MLADTTNSSGWSLAGQVLLLAFMFSNVSVQAVMRSGDPLVRITAVVFAVQLVLLLMARLSAPKRGPVRVRLEAAGVLQENAAPSDALANRLLILYGSCMPGAFLLFWSAATEEAGRRLPLAVTGGALALIAVAFCTVGPLRRGLARVFVKPWAWARGQTVGRTPWSKVNDVMLGRGYFGRHHLRLRRYHPWRLDREFVNVELELTAAQAEALRGRIETWRKAGPAA